MLRYQLSTRCLPSSGKVFKFFPAVFSSQHLVTSYLLANSINHGLTLKTNVCMQYLRAHISDLFWLIFSPLTPPKVLLISDRDLDVSPQVWCLSVILVNVDKILIFSAITYCLLSTTKIRSQSFFHGTLALFGRGKRSHFVF